MFINLLELMNWNNLVVEGLSQFQTIMLIIILKILIFALFKKKNISAKYQLCGYCTAVKVQCLAFMTKQIVQHDEIR